jgi:hypothetical protein
VVVVAAAMSSDEWNEQCRERSCCSDQVHDYMTPLLGRRAGRTEPEGGG